MATEEEIREYNRLRRDVGASEDVLTDAIAEEYFTEALEFYPTDTAKQKAYTRVIAVQGIRASAAMLGKYARNQSTDDLTKVFDNLTEMLRDFEAKLAVAQDPIDQSLISPFFFGVAQGRRGL